MDLFGVKCPHEIVVRDKDGGMSHFLTLLITPYEANILLTLFRQDLKVEINKGPRGVRLVMCEVEEAPSEAG